MMLMTAADAELWLNGSAEEALELQNAGRWMKAIRFSKIGPVPAPLQCGRNCSEGDAE